MFEKMLACHGTKNINILNYELTKFDFARLDLALHTSTYF